MKLFTVVFICCSISHGFVSGIRNERLKRNVFVPALSAYPKPKTRFYLQPPHPIPSAERQKRNVFDPALPAFPNPQTPFYPQPPYPIPPSATISPQSALMPKPPKNWDSDNPFLESMDDPINPNYGLGLTAMQPTIIGGNVNFPVGNLMRPQESVGGTFGFVRPVAVRFGTQGGPFFPWQDKQYAKTIKEINTSNAMAQAYRRDQASDVADNNDNYAVQSLPAAPPVTNSNPPVFRPFKPVLPPPLPTN